jgi:hypothetical protein
MIKPVWLFWETIGKKPEPAYITLCKWCFLHQWPDANIIFLNKGNIESYLPGITNLVDNIEVDIKGRLDRLKRLVIPQKLNEAVKCDVYRAFILKHYGGIYLDISAVPIKPITPYFNILDHDDFFITQRSSHNKRHYPVGFYGTHQGSAIIEEYCEQILIRLQKGKELHYNELGHFMLSPIIEKNKSAVRILPEQVIMPITFEEADQALSSKEIELNDFDLNQILCFKLANQPFKTIFKDYTVSRLYYNDMFIGKLFRHALPENIFKKLKSGY